MKLYFYSSSNAVRDMLSTNMIGCYAMSQKERSKTLGYLSNSSLFLTHKKLKAEQLNYGLTSEASFGETPIVVEITVDDEIAKDIPVVLVNASGKDMVPKASTIAEYDLEKTVGLFWRGFIPFSFVTGFYFESEESMADLYQPSPDLWYPKYLFKVIDETEFCEDINVEGIVPYDNPDDVKGIISEISRYIKERALLYYCIHATEKWQYGKYILNIDPVLIDILQLDVTPVKELIGEAFDDIKSLAAEDVLALGDGSKLFKLHKVILNQLLKTNTSTVFDEAYFDSLSEQIYAELTAQEIDEKFIGDCKKVAGFIKTDVLSSNGDYEKVLEKLKYASPYYALALLLKNPHYDDNFMASFDAYNVPQDVARLAQMYFAAVNGMSFLSGEQKSNLLINRRIDELAIEKIQDAKIPKVIYGESEYKKVFEEDVINTFESYKIVCGMQLTMDEVRTFLLSPEGRKTIKIPAIQKAYGKKKVCEWPKYKYYEIPMDVKKGDRIAATDMEKFIKGAKATNFYKYDVDAFVADMIENVEAFIKLYDTKPDLWKELYKNRKR